MKSNNKRGYIVSLCFLVLLLGVTFIVFRDKLPDIMNAVAQIPAATVTVILGCGLAYQLIDSLMCLILVRSRMPSLTYLQAFELTMCGVFGLVCSNSIITVPMQSVYLYSKSLDVGHTDGLMTVKYILPPAAWFMQCASMKPMQLFDARSHSSRTPYTWQRYANIQPQRPCIHTLLSVEYTSPRRSRQVYMPPLTSSMPLLSQKLMHLSSSDRIHSLASCNFDLSMGSFPLS